MNLRSVKLRTRLEKIGLGIIIAVMLCIVGLPLAWMALSSFKPSVELFKMPPSILPKDWDLVWYRDAFSNDEVVRYFVNSLIISGSAMIVDVVFGTFAAYSLVRFEYTGRKAIMMGVLAAYCIPPIMLMVPLCRIIAGMGLKDSYIGIIIGHLTVTFPFTVWMLMPFFRKIPKVLDEAALVDGASSTQVFFKVDLPLTISGILSTGIMAFILSWNEFLLSSVLISHDYMKTLTVGMSTYISSTEINWGVLMALGTATTIPIVLLFTAIQKYFVEGMTAGAVKG
jgi:ABC-type glycerol-3-phosphate transport system permease component